MRGRLGRRWRGRRAVGPVVAALALAALTPLTAGAEVPGTDEELPVGGAAATAQGAGDGFGQDLRQIANVPSTFPADPQNPQNASVGTDIAFQRNLAYVGNYAGFTVYDIGDPARPRVVSTVRCPGSQNDVSIWGDLLFLSTDSRWTDDSCTATPQPNGALPYWEGIKIFDVRDPRNPRYVASVETDCGSHTHTLVPGRGRSSVFIYVSSYGPAPALSDCQPPHDKISIIEVPRRNPAAAAVVAEPVLFPDGGNPGIPRAQGSDALSAPQVSATSGCHDITVFPSQDLAAGACMGDGILMDISDRRAPRVIERVRDDVNFAFWHSATFNNSGTKVVFTDELGGGGAPTCNPAVGPTRGADGIYDVVGRGDDRSLVFRSYFKIPREQSFAENCVAHNGSLIPVRGRDIMVQAWYQGGISVWDFTDSANPVELGWWDRGPIDPTKLVLGGSWSAYWYDGHVYSSDITRGLDVLEVTDEAITDRARRVRFGELNVQTQPVYRR